MAGGQLAVQRIKQLLMGQLESPTGRDIDL